MKCFTFYLAHLLIISIIWWMFTLFPQCPITRAFDFAGRLLLICMVAYHTSPFWKKAFFREKISTRDKAVLITGCDSGFGYNLAKRLDSKGFRVFASCLFPSGDGAKSLQEACSNSLRILSLDVTKDQSIKEAVTFVKQQLNGSDFWAVVNNAGVLEGFEAEWTELKDYQKAMDINAMGVVRVTKAFLPLLRRSKGRLVSVTSLAGRFSFPGMTAYCMSKFAASCFCECLRQEMHPWGIKVISIEPDFFKTRFATWDVIESRMNETVRNIDEETKEEYGQHYFEAYKKAEQRVMQYNSDQIHKVVDCLEDAVMLKVPCNIYRPRGTIYFRLLFGMLELLPKPIADFFCRCVTAHILKFPSPKGSEKTR